MNPNYTGHESDAPTDVPSAQPVAPQTPLAAKKPAAKPNRLLRLLKHPVVVALLIIILGTGALFGRLIFGSNVTGNQTEYLYLPTGIEMNEVENLLAATGRLDNQWSFSLTARLMRYKKVKPGRYALRPGMSNYELIAALRSGNQVPVDIRFEAVRTVPELATALGKNLEVGPKHIEAALNDTALLSSYGFNKQTILAMFLPNTYSMYWTITPKQLFDRMYKEYQTFWSPARRKKAESIGLTPLEVSVLASIVQAESQKADERPTIAGVYLNRLRKGWPLQADPTVIFAVGDFTIRRVLNKHLEYDSPYNTYKRTGLPPGPINCPSTNAIDAVLNYQVHDYMFFCAKADFSGYHAFAVTQAEHSKNAALFHMKLNELNIKK